jgi:hypothetical protein
MNTMLRVFCVAFHWSVLSLVCAPAAEPIRLLIVEGGHGFDTNEFFQMFRDNPDVTFQAATHPNAQRLWTAEAARQWDVLVLYDMWQDISDTAQADFLARLNEGKGLVVLHHAIANYQKWPEYPKTTGGRYYLEKTLVDGVEKARSQWKHDVEIPVQVAASDHPVTRGLRNFTIHDETYKGYDVSSDVQVLLTTDEPTSAAKIAWAKERGPARIVFIQLGHDRQAYANPNYRQLLRQAIRWTARRD